MLSIEPELTLTEDYTNTITPQNDKLIKISSDMKTKFRIIALCSLEDINKISEAIKSRFNIITVKKYTNKEVQEITGFSDNYVEKFDFHKLILMKSIIEKIKTIHSRDRNASEEIPREILEEQAARIVGKEDPERQNGITPLKLENGILKSDNDYILSFSSSDLTKTNIVITKTTQTMCDRIFSALSLDIPIIIRGPSGTGKSLVADYVANLMQDFANKQNVIRIQLSGSTTVEDLFGRYSIKNDNESNTFDYIPTKLFNAVSEKSQVKSLIIIEELNLASPSLVDALTCLFDNNPESMIMKTNGETEKKGRFSIIGIASGKVPQSLKKSSIYFKRD